MDQDQARSFMYEALLSGYRHHPYALEREGSLLLRDDADLESIFSVLNVETYADILAPDRLRAMKNSFICFVAVISRSAISFGVNPEKSFSISDFYINEAERKNSAQALQNTVAAVITDYRRLVREAQQRVYSLPVLRAVKYIRQHIYGTCTVAEMAASIDYNPQYLATIFKTEVGMTPIEYIRITKIQEARDLLLTKDYSVAEVSQSLGFCNTSYFIREFRRIYDMTPSQYRKTNGPAVSAAENHPRANELLGLQKI